MRFCTLACPARAPLGSIVRPLILETIRLTGRPFAARCLRVKATFLISADVEGLLLTCGLMLTSHAPVLHGMLL